MKHSWSQNIVRGETQAVIKCFLNNPCTTHRIPPASPRADTHRILPAPFTKYSRHYPQNILCPSEADTEYSLHYLQKVPSTPHRKLPQLLTEYSLHSSQNTPQLPPLLTESSIHSSQKTPYTLHRKLPALLTEYPRHFSQNTPCTTHRILPAALLHNGGVAGLETADDEGEDVGGHDRGGGEVLPGPVAVQRGRLLHRHVAERQVACG